MRSKDTLAMLCLGVLLLSSAAVTPAGESSPAAEATGSVVLTEECFWRHYYEPGMMRVSAEALKNLKKDSGLPLTDVVLKRLEADTRRHLAHKNIDWSKTDWRDVSVVHFHKTFQDDLEVQRLLEPAAAPAGWPAPDFDDSAWIRFRHRPLPQQRAGQLNEMLDRAICLRTSFEVPDPQQVKELLLRLTYRGGARVFVNGQELARNHLPSGTLGTDSKADEYPLEAYWIGPEEAPDPHLGGRCVGDLRCVFDRAPAGQGKLSNFRDTGGAGWINRKTWERIMKIRDRELGPLPIPSSLLRKGRNVLAVEIRGSHYHPIVVPGAGDWGKGSAYSTQGWAHARLIRLELSDPSGVVPSAMRRPDKPRVWVEDMHTRCFPQDYCYTSEAMGAVRFSGALNGTFGAQVLVYASGNLPGLKATPGDLKHVENAATLPSSALHVSYLAAEPLKDLVKLGLDRGDIRSPLIPDAIEIVRYVSNNPEVFKPEPGAAIAAELNKLTYFDHLTGAPPKTIPESTSQPIWLSLKIPPDAAPGLYKGSIRIEAAGLEPVSVPMEATVTGWRIPSAREFQTDVWLEQSPYGIAKRYQIPLWSERHFNLIEASFRQMARAGNDTLWIPVIHQSEFGNNKDSSMVRWIRKKDGALDFDYAVLDKYLELAVKHMGHPRSISFCLMHYMRASASPTVTIFDEASGKSETLGVGWKEDAFKRIPMWKAFAYSLYEHMRSKGLEKSLRWGHAGDVESDPSLIALLWDLFPECYWTGSPHSYAGGSGGGGHNRQIFRTISEIYTEFRAESRKGWRKEDETYLNPFCIRNVAGGASPPFSFRVLADWALHKGLTGVGHMGFDYYDFVWKEGYPPVGDWNPPGIPVFTLVYPGQEGAESSARWEAFLEGVQQAEARIFIEQTLERKVLPAPLAQEAQDVVYRNFLSTAACQDGSSNGWQERSTRLFQTACKVAQALGVDVEKMDYKVNVPVLGRTTIALRLRNWTGQPRSWKAASTAAWIVPEKTEGTLSGQEELKIVVDGSTLEIGKAVTGTLTVTDTALGVSFPVTIAATPGPPVEILFDHPNFNVTLGETETREFRIVNRAAGEQSWKLSSSAPWLKVEPEAGKLAPGVTAFVRITAAPPDKEAAIHDNSFTLNAADGRVNKSIASKTFVIPPYSAPGELPLGAVVQIEKLEKQFLKSHAVLGHNSISFCGPNYAGKWQSRETAPNFAASYGYGGGQMQLVFSKKRFDRGLWVTPHHETEYRLEGSGVSAFSAHVGVSSDVAKTVIRDFNLRVNFELWVDGKIKAQSGLMTALDEPRLLLVKDLEQGKELKLVTRLDSNGDNGTFICTWANASFFKKD